MKPGAQQHFLGEVEGGSPMTEAVSDIIQSRRAEADRLEALMQAYPDLQKHTNRWGTVRYYSKEVNDKVQRFDLKHNCGCCSDSPLEVWPYLETEFGKVYSDPPYFWVGEGCWGSDIPYDGWEDKLREAGIPELIIGAVGIHFKAREDNEDEAVSRD